jgi:PIN domain nuclease of toxin-antitoxin system
VILLLDAHALLWWLDDSPELDGQARAAIADPLNDVLISAAMVWEIEVKRALGKLEAPTGLVDALEPAGLGSLPITLRDAEAAARLPDHHRDPFDRMLVAQAALENLVLVTSDPACKALGAETLW